MVQNICSVLKIVEWVCIMLIMALGVQSRGEDHVSNIFSKYLSYNIQYKISDCNNDIIKKDLFTKMKSSYECFWSNELGSHVEDSGKLSFYR